ncbi:SGNH/GDSL hydrolase family protein [Flavobacterium aquicola]|uniref:GDSL-like lipase/acylhydrolase family protein n=1 Tax=Flavobacterium aquicola TaxID=1682742 RepID=A0A3E0DZ11_9FLAO|nr:SGNH/GDSL hydrolase family protein [Flavobacterium aquicola]REG91185.1 GDSL-like lipase/acylhydrolase family protein [Flavobacterium aquicola]
MIKNFKWLLLVSLSFVACNNNDDEDAVVEVPIASGSASFAKYVALGDSFAAGYSDSALFKAAQETSYPSILAQQFAQAGGGAFAIPMMADNTGGLLLGGNVIAGSRLALFGFSPTGSPIITPVSGVPTTEVTAHLAGPFNNLGIPGAKSYHLVAPGYGNVAFVAAGKANPYYARFAVSATTTVLADALVQTPTFFSLFIGGNDVLGYATSGGVGVNQTGNLDPSTYGGNDITDPNVFANVYNALVTNLTANGAKGVVGNLPYVTALPYFTTVPYNPVPLSEAAAAQLNAGYAQYNGGLQLMVKNTLLTEEEAAKRTIKFAAGNNAVVIVDSYLTNLSAYGLPSYRQVTKEDLVVLTARSFIGTTIGGDPTKVNGVSVPLADQWVLTKDEVKEVKDATDAYNVTIDAIAKSKGLAFVDTKAALTQLSSSAGVRFGNFQMTSSYVTGGAFSLDGVHPTPRGYAYIANLFINAINTKYGATLRTVDLAQYQTLFPVTIQ